MLCDFVDYKALILRMWFRGISYIMLISGLPSGPGPVKPCLLIFTKVLLKDNYYSLRIIQKIGSIYADSMEIFCFRRRKKYHIS